MHQGLLEEFHMKKIKHMSGGCGEVRTPDIRLVRATLSQLSYTPACKTVTLCH